MNIYEYIKIEQYDIEELDISNKKLTEILDLTRFYKFVKLNCSNNQLNILPILIPNY
jgi:hypothetical protein